MQGFKLSNAACLLTWLNYPSSPMGRNLSLRLNYNRDDTYTISSGRQFQSFTIKEVLAQGGSAKILIKLNGICPQSWCCDCVRDKNGLALYMLCAYLYTSHMSTYQHLSTSLRKLVVVMLNLAHLSCTFSGAFVSLTNLGFHTGLLYTSMCLTIAWYRVWTFVWVSPIPLITMQISSRWLAFPEYC